MALGKLFQNNWKFVALLVVAVLLVAFVSTKACATELDAVIFGDVPVMTWNAPEVRPVWTAGLRVELNSFWWKGLGLYTQFVTGKANTQQTDIANTCNKPEGCVWPDDFVNHFKGGEYYQAISIGVSQRFNLFGK